MSNGNWKKYGGVSQINSFNVINTSALIADQFVSRSTRPSNQEFVGSLEISIDVKAGNDVTAGNNVIAGNSIVALNELFVSNNSYINNKLYFFSKDPSSESPLVDLSTSLPLDTSHAFITGDVSNIGINTVNPKTIFHISCDVSNVTDILTVESSGGRIRSIMSQTADKKGIVFDISDESSLINFYNGGDEDISTNELNVPTAYIRHVSGGFLTARTGTTIDLSAGTLFVDTSGVNLTLDSSGVVLESSGNIIIDTSSSFMLDTSCGYLHMKDSSGSFLIGASGDFELMSSISGENIGAIFKLNEKEAFMSTSGSIIMNASGGLIELDATGDGLIRFNSGGFNLNTTLNFAPPSVDLSSSTMYNETITIYDNKAKAFFSDIYAQDISSTAIKSGSALLLRSQDISDNTNMKIVSAVSGKGAQINGGMYPSDHNKSMAMFGVTDLSNDFTPNSMIVSGNDRHSIKTTLGVNTFQPLTDQFVLDVNGPTHINNTEIHSVALSTFQFQNMHFSRSHPLSGLVTGQPSNNRTEEFSQFLLLTKDGGKTWISSNIYEQEDATYEPEEQTEDQNQIQFKQVFLNDLNYGFIGGNDSKLYVTKNGGEDWKKVDGGINNTFVCQALGGTILNIDSNLTYRFFNVYDENTVDYSQMAYFDMSSANIDTLLDLNQDLLKIGNDEVGTNGVDILSRTLSFQNRIETVTSIDTSGSYLYICGTTGIDRIDITTDILQLQTGGGYPRTTTTAPGITAADLNYNHIRVLDDSKVIAVGDNIISATVDGTNWVDVSVNMVNNIGDVSLNQAFLVDASNAIVVGERGKILFSYDWGNPDKWQTILPSLINSGGTQNLLQDICNNLVGISMPENGKYIIANNNEEFVLETQDASGTSGKSRVEYLTMPFLFHNHENFILEGSGNIAFTGDIMLHEGNITTKNITSDTGTLKVGYDISFINIGECLTPEQLFLNVGNPSFGAKDLSDGYQVINIGATNPSSENDLRSYHINVGNPFGFDSKYLGKGHNIFIGGGDDKVVIDGSSVEFKSQKELVILTGMDIGGDLSVNGFVSVANDVSLNQRLFVENDVQINGNLAVQQYNENNIIQTTISNYSFLSVVEDMSLAGRLFVRDNISIKPATVITEHQHEPLVSIDCRDCSDAIHVPAGTTAERPNVQVNGVNSSIYKGYIRYNTEQDTFEGYGAGPAWGSLGGVIDVDQDTFIKAEVNAGGDEDQLRFFTASGDEYLIDAPPQLRMVIDGSGVAIGGTFSTDISNNRLTISPTGDHAPPDGLIVEGRVGIGSMRPAVSLDLSMCRDAIHIPIGASGERPNVKVNGLNHESYKGYIRYNTDQDTFEGFGAGNAWGSLGGVIDVDQDTKIIAETAAGVDNDQLQFFTDGSLNMIIDTSGCVGIGVTSASALLDISGILIHRGPRSEALTSELTENVSRPLIIGSPISNYKWGTDNTFIGMDSLTNFQYGSNFTVVGNETFQQYIGLPLVVGNNTWSSQHSSSNVAIGDNAGNGLTYGGYNTFLGANTKIESSVVNSNFGTTNEITNSTAIGYNAEITGSNQIVLGGVSGVDLTTYPDVYISGNTYVTLQVQAASFNATSDARLKENIIPIKESLKIINQLQGVHFNWIEDVSNNLNTGFIAQDIEKVIPEVVSTTKEKSKKGIHTKSINYSAVVPYLVESVKTLSNEVENLKNENKELKEKMKQYDLWFAELLNK